MPVGGLLPSPSSRPLPAEKSERGTRGPGRRDGRRAPGAGQAQGAAPPPAPGPPLTWAADRGLNPRFLQHGDPVDGTFNVLGEHIPVQVEEAKGKLVRHLGRRAGNCPVTAPHGSESQAGPGQPLD